MKTEIWNNHEIRFIEKESGQWWGVLKDITNALDLTPKGVSQRLDDEVISNYPIPDKLGRTQEMLIVNPFGIYEVIFSSRKPEAKTFKKWVFGVIEGLRHSSGLEGFQVFRMLDKEHQRKAMERLKMGVHSPKQVDYIKANTIANKAISMLHGYPKMLKKDDMPPEWLPERQSILDDTVNLMTASKQFNLDLSVSKMVYRRYSI